ncbi:protein Bch1p [Trichomonascus vanleenenianus]|uniref:protein Bch1p n=1 Tax=Trichomonascus vanleenenianus TaxID=2268995 RepID=UPI003ECB9626
MTAIPEILENEVGEAIGARTASLASFKGLGPPDLVHLSKSQPKSKECGTYHYVSGVDTSSSSSMAAYINTLTFKLGESQLWFGKHPQWKIHSGMYCSYNAFSKVDVRVCAKIPGSVDAYVVDPRGTKHPWPQDGQADIMSNETYMSAMLRALLLADDDVYYVSCCRRLNPLAATEAPRFFEAFRKLFMLGPNLGSAAEIQVPSLSQNYLVDGFFQYVKISGLFDNALEVLESLEEAEPEVANIRAKLLLLKDEEVWAVQVMHSAIKQNPRDALMLEQQAKFCLDKGRLDLALDCAVRAVNAAPSEFTSWAALVEVYTAREEYENALLTLNSCPMFTYHEPDSHRMPQPAKVHLPLPTDGVLDEVWNAGSDIATEQEGADPELLKLPAPTLRATFAKAYELLTKIVANIGWDALLKYRSVVFVMEEEYKKDKRNGSDSAINKPPAAVNNNNVNGSAEGEEEKITNGNGSVETAPSTAGAAFGLKNKRLCERWLDNLFMVLYEDLRVYTVWRAEHVHFQSQQQPYHKTPLEWEILGTVAKRLHHRPEALDAFTESIQARFSHRVLWHILDYQLEDLENLNGKKNASAIVDEALDTVVKLIAWNHRWYTDFSPKLLTALRRIVSLEGLVRVQINLQAKYSGQGIVELMHEWFTVLQALKADGIDS